MNRPPMSARDRLQVMVRTAPGSMTVWSEVEVRDALDAYRAEVLAEAADLVAKFTGSELDANAKMLHRMAADATWLPNGGHDGDCAYVGGISRDCTCGGVR